MQAGDTKKYYHGTLDKTFPVKKGASRSMTKKQAEELL